jgi:hypothetical protein
MSVMFVLVPIIVVGGFVFVIGSFIVRAIQNAASPLLMRGARIVGKREHISANSNAENRTSSTTTTYYLTFEFTDGVREELQVAAREFGLLMEGDQGTLRSQGTWFKGFERDRVQAQA